MTVHLLPPWGQTALHRALHQARVRRGHFPQTLATFQLLQTMMPSH